MFGFVMIVYQSIFIDINYTYIYYQKKMVNEELNISTKYKSCNEFKYTDDNGVDGVNRIKMMDTRCRIKWDKKKWRKRKKMGNLKINCDLDEDLIVSLDSYNIFLHVYLNNGE